MYFLLCIINLTKVHPGPFNCSFLITGQHVARTVCIIWSCAFQCAPTRCWFMRLLLFPYYLHLPSGAAGLCPLGLFCFTRCIPNTLNFWQKLDDSAPFSRFLLLVLAVQRFLEEALKMSAKYLIVLLTLSEKGLHICRQTCWIYPCKLA